MARESGSSLDPLAYDFARNDAELGGGFPIYQTSLSLSGGLQYAPSESSTFFGQTVGPILGNQNPYNWIILAAAIILGLMIITNKRQQ